MKWSQNLDLSLRLASETFRGEQEAFFQPAKATLAALACSFSRGRETFSCSQNWIICLHVFRSCCIEIGFSRKSIAPKRVASIAVSMVPWPDIITMGHLTVLCEYHSLSREMPSMSGIQMSRRIRSKSCLPTRL